MSNTPVLIDCPSCSDRFYSKGPGARTRHDKCPTCGERIERAERTDRIERDAATVPADRSAQTTPLDHVVDRRPAMPPPAAAVRLEEPDFKPTALVAASVGAFLLMTVIDEFVARETTTELVNRIADRAGIDIGVADGVIALAQLAAMFIVVAPFVTRLWRPSA